MFVILSSSHSSRSFTHIHIWIVHRRSYARWSYKPTQRCAYGVSELSHLEINRRSFARMEFRSCRILGDCHDWIVESLAPRHKSKQKKSAL